MEPHVVRYSPNPSRRSKFVIFDRDGTLTIDSGYTYKVRDFAWNPEIIPSLTLLSNLRMPIAVATNQSGVSRGFFTLSEVDDFHRTLVSEAGKIGVNIVVIATCPHPATKPPICSCRKPLPGLLHQIVTHLGVDSTECIFVGDKKSDIEAGEAAGISSYFVKDSQTVLDGYVS